MGEKNHTERPDEFSPPDQMDQGSAPQLLDYILTRLDAGQPLEISCPNVTKTSTACAQILVAADQALKERGQGLVLKNPSESVAQSLADLGLGDFLEAWSG